MKHIKTEAKETKIFPRTITIELTNEELNYIVSSICVAKKEDIKRDILGSDLFYDEEIFDDLYSELIILSDFN